MSAVVQAWLAGLLSIGGAMLLYLATPHQQLVRGAIRHRRWITGAGALALLGALLILLRITGPATAVFVLLTIVSLVWSAVPLGVAWRRAAGGER